MLARDALPAWIEDLRGRLDRGELDPNTTAGAPAAYLVLLVDSWRCATEEERREPGAPREQRRIAEELSERHGHLVEHKPMH